jgi:hypothetical protein
MVWRVAGWPVAPRLDSFHDLWTMPTLPEAATPKDRSTIVTTILWNI